MKMGKGPVSESFLFLITTVPVLMVVVYFSNQLAGQGWGVLPNQPHHLRNRFVWDAHLKTSVPQHQQARV